MAVNKGSLCKQHTEGTFYGSWIPTHKTFQRLIWHAEWKRGGHSLKGAF